MLVSAALLTSQRELGMVVAAAVELVVACGAEQRALCDGGVILGWEDALGEVVEREGVFCDAGGDNL